jgi:isoleucyl-tRNA synthetase
MARFIDRHVELVRPAQPAPILAGDRAALATLREAPSTVSLLMASIVRFTTEQVWQHLVVPVTPGAPQSVHL